MKALVQASLILAALLQPAVGSGASDRDGVHITSLASCFWNPDLLGQERLEPCSDPVVIWPAEDHTRPTYSDEYAMYLQSNVPYILSWEGADADHPVRVTWDVFHYPLPEFNVTKGQNSFNFTFRDLASEFVKIRPNVTIQDIESRLLNRKTQLSIAQPDLDGRRSSSLGGSVRRIIILSEYIFLSIDAEIQKQRSKVYDKWKLGVGVGVGLGVPSLMLAAYLAGRLPERKKRLGSPQLQHQK